MNAACELFFGGKADELFGALQFEGSFDGDRSMGAIAKLITCHRMRPGESLAVRMEKVGSMANEIDACDVDTVFASILGGEIANDTILIVDLACLVKKKYQIFETFDLYFNGVYDGFSERVDIREEISKRCNEPSRTYVDETSNRAVVIVGHMTYQMYSLLIAFFPCFVPKIFGVLERHDPDAELLTLAFCSSSGSHLSWKVQEAIEVRAKALGLTVTVGG